MQLSILFILHHVGENSSYPVLSSIIGQDYGLRWVSARGGNQPEVPFVLHERLGSALVLNATSASCSESFRARQVETSFGRNFE